MIAIFVEHTHCISLWNCNDTFSTDSLWNQINLPLPASIFRARNAITVRNEQMRECCIASRTPLLIIPVQDQSNAILYKANYAACCDFWEVLARKFILNGQLIIWKANFEGLTFCEVRWQTNIKCIFFDTIKAFSIVS